MGQAGKEDGYAGRIRLISLQTRLPFTFLCVLLCDSVQRLHSPGDIISSQFFGNSLPKTRQQEDLTRRAESSVELPLALESNVNNAADPSLFFVPPPVNSLSRH